MIIELTDTNAAEIGQRILAARARAGVPTGLVVTLIAVAEGCEPIDVLKAAIDAGREHPSRILIVTDAEGPTRLDAVLRVGGEVPGDIVELTFRGELTRHRASVLLPLLLPDCPVVVWWPGISPDVPSEDPIGRLARRRITDSMGSPLPISTLLERARNHSPGDADLVWTRLTRWRTLLAAAVEHYPAEVRRVRVHAVAGNAAGLLLAAWLDDRLGVEVQLHDDPEGIGITEVVLETDAGDVSVARTAGTMAVFSAPGVRRRVVARPRRALPARITEVVLATDAGDVSVARTDGTMAVFSAPGVRRRLVALPRRDLNALITEELRRLDEDAAYATTMGTLATRWDAAFGEDRR